MRRGDDNRKVLFPRTPSALRPTLVFRSANRTDFSGIAPDARARAGANALFYPLLIIYSTVVNQSEEWNGPRKQGVRRGRDQCNRPAYVNASPYARRAACKYTRECRAASRLPVLRELIM